MGEVYHKIQIVRVLVKQLHLIIKLLHRIRNILRFYKMGENTGV